MDENQVVQQLIAGELLTARQAERAREQRQQTGAASLREVILGLGLVTPPEWEQAAAKLTAPAAPDGGGTIPTFDDLLGELSFNDVKLFSDILESETYADGGVLFDAGQPGDRVYIIKEGEVGIVKGNATVAILKMGDLLGELSFILGWQRTARGVAAGATEVLAIPRPKFLKFCERYPITGLKILFGLLKVVCFRLQRFEANLGRGGKPFTPPVLKYESGYGITWHEIHDLLEPAAALAFEQITLGRTVKEGEFIIRQGSGGEQLYAIRGGEVEVLKDDGAGRPLRLAVLGDGYVFGEMAFILGWPRVASVRTLKPTTVSIIDKAGFEGFMVKYPRAALQIVLVLAKLISYRLEMYSQA